MSVAIIGVKLSLKGQQLEMPRTIVQHVRIARVGHPRILTTPKLAAPVLAATTEGRLPPACRLKATAAAVRPWPCAAAAPARATAA